MEFKNLVVALFLLIFLSFNSAVLAEDTAMKTMANIMMNLNHYPSDSEKGQLMDISKNKMSNANQKILANAMINLQHRAAAADIPKLKSVANNQKASQGEKDLANIIIGLSHTPSTEDKSKLQMILK